MASPFDNFSDDEEEISNVNQFELRSLEEDDDDRLLFLEEQDDLQLLHEGAVENQRRRDVMTKVLMGTNIVFLVLCILFASLFALIVYMYWRLNHAPRKGLSELIPKCQILEAYLKDKSGFNNNQLYFDNEFLADMHKQNRAKFMSAFGSEKFLVHMQGTPKLSNYASGRSTFRQNPNFLYLTGVNLPDYELIIDFDSGKTYLFAPEPNNYDPVWTNSKVESLEQQKKRFGVDQVLYRSNVTDVIADLERQDLYYIDHEMNVFKMINDGDLERNWTRTNTSQFVDAFNEVRSVKSDAEITVMKKVNEISSYAHTQLMRQLTSESWEYEIAGYFELLCQSCGLVEHAYDPIVASGENAAIMHYTVGKRLANVGDILLIDAGAEFLGYASDISRTYPIGGIFNEQQRMLYSAALTVQEKTLNLVRAGANFTEINRASNKFMLEELICLQFLTHSKSVDQLLDLKIHTVFRPHGLGHLIGLQVHDTTVYPRTLLKKNHVITIEPGIYLNSYLLQNLNQEQRAVLNSTRVTEFINAKANGFRIEDDIVVTEDGYSMLTTTPKTIEEIETIMRR